MDWLIQEKMLTYFYNTFRPVNHMHYIKCGVNSSLLTILVAAEGLWHLGSLFYHNTVFKKGVFYKFTLVWYSTKQGKLNRPTSHLVHLYTVPFLWVREAHRQQHIWVDFAGQCLLWRLSSRKTFFAPTFGLTTSLVLGRSWLSSASSINFLNRRSLKSVWVYLAPHEDNGIELLSTVRSRSWKNNFMIHLLLDSLDWQKDEYLCSFLEAVPRLVISHFL